MNYENHLEEISSKLEVIDNFLSEEECNEILDFVSSLKLNDRSTFLPNYGLKQDVGNYNSIGFTPYNYPEFWNKIFKNKLVNAFEPVEVQINEYQKGHYIPPHKDKGISLYTVSVPLQTDDKNYLMFGDPDAYYKEIPVEESNEKGMTKSFSDIKGRGYMFSGTNPIHWVPPTNSLRYSAIFLYSFPL